MNNTSCVFTVIKNEQEYLDEWIRYHLNLGIDHLFIFEDLNSESHKDITDKYADKVTLEKIINIFSDKDIPHILFKKQHKKSVQHSYIQTGLKYLQEKYDYDWCFVIDVDEFITLENDSDNLKDILNLYNKYDAIVLQWKNYGANELIYKPDYSNKGLIDTFINPAVGEVHNDPVWLTKTCYKLKDFNDRFYRTHHQPSENSNWCRTDFSRNRYNKIYDKIYIRHYITKSWEEYVTKLNIRGMFGTKRSYDNFFQINPELLSKKDELLILANNIIKKHI